MCVFPLRAGLLMGYAARFDDLFGACGAAAWVLGVPGRFAGAAGRTKTAHVGRQWLGRYGKTDNGLVTVTTVWVDERAATLAPGWRSR